MRFPVAIHKEKSSCFGVIVPDIPGCFSAGDTLEEALESTRDAIIAHLNLLSETTLPQIEIKSIEIHKANTDFNKVIWAFVDIDPLTAFGETKKINVTLPQNLIYQIDEMVKKHPELYSRSSFITQACIDAIKQHD